MVMDTAKPSSGGWASGGGPQRDAHAQRVGRDHDEGLPAQQAKEARAHPDR
jgi:hypothetical protein